MSAPATTSNSPSFDPHLDDAELRAWRGLLRVHAALVKRLDAELDAAHGLPFTTYDVLDLLEQASDHRMRMCDLAACVQLSRSGVTRLVDRLEREGLVERCGCEKDGRGQFAVLTELGRSRLEEARPTLLDGARRDFLGHFSPAELDRLVKYWERVVPPPPASAGPSAPKH